MLKPLLPLFTRILTVTLLLIYEGILTSTLNDLANAERLSGDFDSAEKHYNSALLIDKKRVVHQ
jgi:hypothetical protein